MSRRRLQRALTAFVAVLSLLWAQWSLAAYACPMQTAALALQMQDCEGMDEVQPLLCHQHRADAAQSAASPELPAPAQPALLQVLELPALPETAPLLLDSPAAAPELQPPPDPVFLATRRLRV